MASLMLVNPRKRRKKAKSAHKRPRKPAAHSAPKRRKRRASTKRRVYARNPITISHAKRKHRRRYRRNPIGGMRGGMKGLFAPVMPAAISAVGAIGLDLAWGQVAARLPAAITGGPMKYVAKAVGAIGIGMLAGMVVKKDTANQLAIGALTTVFHSAMRDTITQMAPNVQLGEYETMNGYPLDGLAEYVREPGMAGLGEYQSDMGAIGYANPGMYAGEDNLTDMEELGAIAPFSM